MDDRKIDYTIVDKMVSGPPEFHLYVAFQSHRRDQFGADGNHFRAANKITLYSCVCPCWDRSSSAYLRGSDRSKDSDPLVFPDRDTRHRVVSAILDYNRTNGGFGHLREEKDTTSKPSEDWESRINSKRDALLKSMFT